MRRGTTPTHTFTVDLDLTTAQEIYLTYEQEQGLEVYEIEKTKADMEITADTIQVKLTQAETLKFNTTTKVKIQFRAIFEDGNAVASNIMTASADEILKEGEI